MASRANDERRRRRGGAVGDARNIPSDYVSFHSGDAAGGGGSGSGGGGGGGDIAIDGAGLKGNQKEEDGSVDRAASSGDDPDSNSHDERRMDLEELAVDTEEMFRFSSRLTRSYLEQRRLTDENGGGGDGGGDVADGEEYDDDGCGEACPFRLLSRFDLLLGSSLLGYGSAIPLAALVRLALYRRGTVVPVRAVLASLMLGAVTLRAGSAGDRFSSSSSSLAAEAEAEAEASTAMADAARTPLTPPPPRPGHRRQRRRGRGRREEERLSRRHRRRRRVNGGAIVAFVSETAVAILSETRWDDIVTYLERHREALLLGRGFVRAARDDVRARTWFVAATSVLAALELCRALSSWRWWGRGGHDSSSSSYVSSNGEGRRIDGGHGEDEDEGGGGFEEANDNEIYGRDWAASNARRWETWRDECDPGLRDRSGNYDPDAMRRYGGVLRLEEEVVNSGPGDTLTEPLLEGDSLGRREESFEMRHGLSRRTRTVRGNGDDEGSGESSGGDGAGSGGGGGGFLFALQFWRSRRSRGVDGEVAAPNTPGDVHSVGEGSSAGFAPVEGDLVSAEPLSLRDV